MIQSNPPTLPTYRSHKIVQAAKILEIQGYSDGSGANLLCLADLSAETGAMIEIGVTRAYFLKHQPKAGGYYVLYPDGYESWSPAEAFEEGYTKVEADTPYPPREETLTTGQPAITGYRNLSPQEVALMNEGKALAQRCGEYIDKLRGYVPMNMSGPEGGEAEAFRPGATLDQRWISIGATDLQRGFMAVIRGIAQPTTF